jgi:Protein of unknown function (DUF3833)
MKRKQGSATIYILFFLLLNGLVTPLAATEWPSDFVLEDYFSGEITAWGVFEDRQGNLKREFKVHLSGQKNQSELVLTEHFVYADGEKQTRIWRIKPSGPGRYEGRADDVVGTAIGELRENHLYWRYTLNLPVGEKTYKVQFNDKMYLQPDGVLINRAIVTKWGFRIGEVTIVFMPVQ